MIGVVRRTEHSPDLLEDTRAPSVSPLFGIEECRQHVGVARDHEERRFEILFAMDRTELEKVTMSVRWLEIVGSLQM